MTAIRCIVAIAIKQGWPLFQLDVSNMFSHGDYNEEVLRKFPPGLLGPSDSHVCQLCKSLYRLKQASHQQYAHLSATLGTRGSISLLNDFFLLFKNSRTLVMILVVYVDDILLTGNDQHEIDKLK